MNADAPHAAPSQGVVYLRCLSRNVEDSSKAALNTHGMYMHNTYACCIQYVISVFILQSDLKWLQGLSCFLCSVCTVIIIWDIRAWFFFHKKLHCSFYYAMWSVFMSVVHLTPAERTDMSLWDVLSGVISVKCCALRLKNQSYLNVEYDGKLLTSQTQLATLMTLTDENLTSTTFSIDCKETVKLTKNTMK